MRKKQAIRIAGGLLLFASFARSGTDPQIDSFESLIKAGKYADAQEQLQIYVSSHSGSWQAQYQLGYIFFHVHRLQDSVDALCKSILLKSDFADSHRILAYALNMLGHPELARTELERSIQIDSSSAESHYELGRIDYEQGAYSAAVTELEKAKSLSPSSVRVYHNLGLAYSALEQHSLAVSSFEQGLAANDRQNPKSAWPLIDYATYRNNQGQFEMARVLLERAIAIESSWDQAYEELSKAYRGLGKTAEAIDMLEKALVLNPNKTESHYVLFRLYTQAGRQEEAARELTSYQRAKEIAAK